MRKKSHYACQECGATTTQWSGKCLDCGQWNTMTEVVAVKKNRQREKGYTGTQSELVSLKNITTTEQDRISTQVAELDRVLGGGLVKGAVILMGGDPGIGKSTILLQMLSNLCDTYKTLYVSGEESLQQIKLRADRLGLQHLDISLYAETHVETIINTGLIHQPKLMVIDSIQTMYTELVQSAAGSVSQVREAAAQFVSFAKQTGTILILVGHVTKDGTLAGPRVLEHMVDTVLYFEGESGNRFRLLRSVKNRFGAVNELGVFAMTDKGLREMNNPSAIFLNRYQYTGAGSVIMVMWEGSRPLLLEIQALVDDSHLGNPRRVVVGMEQNRLALILAVLNRHGGVMSSQQDIFVNLVGGVKALETGSDLPALVAILSSLKDKPFSNDTVVFGEVGLSGEIRPVQSGQERLKEAQKLGFKRAILPFANMPKEIKDFQMTLVPVKTVQEVIALFRE